MIIKTRAPLRLGLAGGGTDVSPYCDIHGGYVLNATIDRYAYAILETIDEPEVRFNAMDKQNQKRLPLQSQIPLNGILDLHKAVYNHMVMNFNWGKPLAIALSTQCDAPPGSGLGSSSTLVVAMVQAFVELLNLPLDQYAVAQLAYKIERVDCRLRGGRQDQYSATFGGFNFMEFHGDDHDIINPLRIKDSIICELEASLILFFTGKSRESAQIIAEQSKNIESGRSISLEAMHALKNEAMSMKAALLKGDFNALVESMRLGWENKKLTAHSVSNSQIDHIYESALAAGAVAGKVSGAGGGGFMLFFVPLQKRMDVIRCLRELPGTVSNCHFTNYGAQAWRSNC